MIGAQWLQGGRKNILSSPYFNRAWPFWFYKTTEKISGATIKLYPWNDTNNEVTVTSNINGKFVIEQLKHWRVTYPIMGDPIMYGHITVSFEGYITVKREYFLSTGELFVEGGPIYQFGLIELERKNAPNK